LLIMLKVFTFLPSSSTSLICWGIMHILKTQLIERKYILDCEIIIKSIAIITKFLLHGSCLSHYLANNDDVVEAILVHLFVKFKI
jgi:hypothetical protein